MDILLTALITAALTGAAVWFFASARLNAQLLKANDHAAQERNGLVAELATAKANIVSAAQQQEQMKLWFENTANRVVKETSAQLNATSQEQLGQILNPVRERIGEFQKKVEEVYGAESRERIGLAKQIELALQMNQQTSEAANNLTLALKGDAKKRGNWGEMTLENILTDSGLSEYDYITQGRDLDLKDEQGRRQLPDVIIRMPQGKHIIIDSKVTLNSYLELMQADEDARPALQQQYANAVKKHVDDLSAKKYQDNDKLIAHDFVLMFIPIESALAIALDGASNLQSYAWSKRVALVGPSSLMMTLHTLASIWQGEKLERNANEIAKEAAGLYDKLRNVVDSLNGLGKNIDQSKAAYDKAIGQLATGPGNVLKRVESFRKRGISVDKPMAQLDYLPAEPEEITD